MLGAVAFRLTGARRMRVLEDRSLVINMEFSKGFLWHNSATMRLRDFSEATGTNAHCIMALWDSHEVINLDGSASCSSNCILSLGSAVKD